MRFWGAVNPIARTERSFARECDNIKSIFEFFAQHDKNLYWFKMYLYDEQNDRWVEMEHP